MYWYIFESHAAADLSGDQLLRAEARFSFQRQPRANNRSSVRLTDQKASTM